MELTSAHLRYLLAIYEVSQTHLDISSRSIAEKLGVTKPSVVRIMNLLMERGMIVKEHYGKIYMTDRGIWVAKQVDRELKTILTHFPPVSEPLSEEERFTAALAMTSALPERIFTGEYERLFGSDAEKWQKRRKPSDQQKSCCPFDQRCAAVCGSQCGISNGWGLLCNVIFVRAIAQLVGAAFAGSLTSAQLWQNLVLCLATVPMRFAFTMLASAMSDQASKDVKRTLRSSIYAKLARLGPNYTETAATSEVVMLASEGVEQIDTYFAKYLPQLFYSLLAPVTLFVLLVGVHARSAIILLCCVPLDPHVHCGSAEVCQKAAGELLGAKYTTLGDSFLENIQGLTTLKIYQADGWKHEQMNAQAERFRRITMKVLTMQLNSVTLMDLMAYGGAGFGIISAVAAFAAGRLTLTATLTIVLLAADVFPAAAAAGQLLPHCHERCRFGREDLQASGSGRACRW